MQTLNITIYGIDSEWLFCVISIAFALDIDSATAPMEMYAMMVEPRGKKVCRSGLFE